MKVKEESESWVGLAPLTLINSLITEQEELNRQISIYPSFDFAKHLYAQGQRQDDQLQPDQCVKKHQLTVTDQNSCIWPLGSSGIHLISSTYCEFFMKCSGLDVVINVQ